MARGHEAGRRDFRAAQRFDSAQRDNVVILSEVEGRATEAQEARRERPRLLPPSNAQPAKAFILHPPYQPAL
jgi:hypothetical protein